MELGKVFLMCDAHRLLRHTGDITDGAIVFGYKLFSRSANLSVFSNSDFCLYLCKMVLFLTRVFQMLLKKAESTGSILQGPRWFQGPDPEDVFLLR